MGLESDTLAWLDSNQAQVAAHEGAAYEEVELLRLMLSGASGVGGVMSAAYRNKLAFYIPSLTGRAGARAYAHIVMFAADFGLDPVTHPALVNPMLDEAVFAHQDDTDTLGELLIACHLLGHDSPVIQAASEKFLTDWQAIPRDFTNYHPILVGGILFALQGV
jgi:hypothetical protein